MVNRIYLVTVGADQHLVRAKNKYCAQAVIVKDTVRVELASQELLIKMTKECKEVIEAHEAAVENKVHFTAHNTIDAAA